ncbi:hypothetical protein HAX54_016750, partial [Datura stramonium]|nr:hypothetical protein [Datura stramonium]
ALPFGRLTFLACRALHRAEGRAPRACCSAGRPCLTPGIVLNCCCFARLVAWTGRRLVPLVAQHWETAPHAWHCAKLLLLRTTGSVDRQAPCASGHAGVPGCYAAGRSGMA